MNKKINILLFILIFTTLLWASPDNVNPKLKEFSWYKSIGTIKTYTADKSPSKIRVVIFIGYEENDKITLKEISENKKQIRNFLKKYFKSQTASALKDANNEDFFRMEIKNKLNDNFLHNGKILTISFAELDIISGRLSQK